jgi:hypothetical protein
MVAAGEKARTARRRQHHRRTGRTERSASIGSREANLRKFSDDIIRFVHRHFDRQVIQRVYDELDHGSLHTPREVRAVLYLSGGSFALLKHYIDMAEKDVPQVLTWAECVVGVAPEPMVVRDMSKPFTDDRNLGIG